MAASTPRSRLVAGRFIFRAERADLGADPWRVHLQRNAERLFRLVRHHAHLPSAFRRDSWLGGSVRGSAVVAAILGAHERPCLCRLPRRDAGRGLPSISATNIIKWAAMIATLGFSVLAELAHHRQGQPPG